MAVTQRRPLLSAFPVRPLNHPTTDLFPAVRDHFVSSRGSTAERQIHLGMSRNLQPKLEVPYQPVTDDEGFH